MPKRPRAANRPARKGSNVATHAPVDSLADYVTKALQIKDQWWQQDIEEERRRRKNKETQEDNGLRPPSDFWFRGHADARWQLTPRLYRPESRLKQEDEDEIRTDFKRRGRQL